ncbi:MAG TPA: hypothetical protein VEA44_08075 [Caulobacter sp.]|nr:hypothetical protein [Caulobacter sp.]
MDLGPRPDWAVKAPKGFDKGVWRLRGREGWMRIRRLSKGRWRVRIYAHAPDRGTATAAPCGLVAEGSFVRGRFVANVVPYEEFGYSVDENSLKRQNNILVIDFAPGKAVVEEGTPWGICGLLAEVSGDYVK